VIGLVGTVRMGSLSRLLAWLRGGDHGAAVNGFWCADGQ
jgi:hypothetical protein